MIFSRTSRLSHPPILYRGTKPLTYGQGIPAPWNGNPESAAQPPPTPVVAKPATAKDALPNGKDKDKDKDKDSSGQAKTSAALPDARLYATWDYEPKDYRVPLPMPSRSRNRIAPGASSAYSGAAASPSTSTPAGGGGIAAGAVGGLRSRSSSRIV